jgi:hypothetical protein
MAHAQLKRMPNVLHLAERGRVPILIAHQIHATHRTIAHLAQTALLLPLLLWQLVELLIQIATDVQLGIALGCVIIACRVSIGVIGLHIPITYAIRVLKLRYFCIQPILKFNCI